MRKNKDLFSIFPADAGVNLKLTRHTTDVPDIPRGCGGEPSIAQTHGDAFQYSPRMRG